MTRSNLEKRLKSEGIDPATYDLAGVGKDEAYCLEQADSGWLVYYRERRNRNFEHMFSTESDACDFILKEILQDPTTRL